MRGTSLLKILSRAFSKLREFGGRTYFRRFFLRKSKRNTFLGTGVRWMVVCICEWRGVSVVCVVEGMHKYACDVCGVVCVVYIRVRREHVCGMWVCVCLCTCVF